MLYIYISATLGLLVYIAGGWLSPIGMSRARTAGCFSVAKVFLVWFGLLLEGIERHSKGFLAAANTLRQYCSGTVEWRYIKPIFVLKVVFGCFQVLCRYLHIALRRNCFYSYWNS